MPDAKIALLDAVFLTPEGDKLHPRIANDVPAISQNLNPVINYGVRRLKRRRGPVIKPAFRGKIRSRDNYRNY
jgi:hypothetical protein